MPTTTTMMPDPENGWPPRPKGWPGAWPPWAPWADIAAQRSNSIRDTAFVLASISLHPEFARRFAAGEITAKTLGLGMNAATSKELVTFASHVSFGDWDGGDPCGTGYPGKRVPKPRPWPHIGVLDERVALARRDAALLGLAVATRPEYRAKVATSAARVAKDLNLEHVSEDALASMAGVAKSMQG
jgi:hypothetical protein